MRTKFAFDEIVTRIRKVARPKSIVLFGSRARGQFRSNSDYDLLIVQESALPRHRRSGSIYKALADLSAEFDVIVYTPEEVRDWAEVPHALVTTALREGKVLYEE